MNLRLLIVHMVFQVYCKPILRFPLRNIKHGLREFASVNGHYGKKLSNDRSPRSQTHWSKLPM